METAFFVKRPRILEDLRRPWLASSARRYQVVGEVVLAAADYENFITDMLADRQFLADAAARCGEGEVMDCLLVRHRGKSDGVLVVPERGAFVGWAAYIERAGAREACKRTGRPV